MRQKIEKFCEEIKKDYWLYLYSNTFIKTGIGKEQHAGFPCCCRVSAKIITLYLQKCFGEEFQYYQASQRFSMHAFTKYKNTRNEEFIIDFTDFQFALKDDIKKKIMKNELHEESVWNFIKPHPVVVDVLGGNFGFHNMAIAYKVNIFEKIEFEPYLSKQNFIEFLDKIWQSVNNETEYN